MEFREFAGENGDPRTEEPKTGLDAFAAIGLPGRDIICLSAGNHGNGIHPGAVGHRRGGEMGA